MAGEFEIVVGTYEQYILGYKIERTQEAQYVIKQTFATKSHTGSIRAVACSDRLLASAGTDDRIFIYDMNTRKEIQMLNHHAGTVNTIAFTPKASHILSGSSDGSLAVVRTGNWQTEKLWSSAHKKLSVNNVAVHPSGKLALSIGEDHVLRTWNLVKGRHAYATNLASRGPHGKFLDAVHWSVEGTFFTLTGSKKLEIWSIEQAEVVDEQELESKIISCCWILETKLVCGLEDGNLIIYDTKKKSKDIFKGHKCRIKCIAALNDHIVTCDSSGVIKLWLNNGEEIQEMCSINASCRITCITLIDNKCIKREKVDEVQNQDKDEGNHAESEDEKIPVNNFKKKREIVIIEQEINEVRVSKDDKKNKKILKKSDIKVDNILHKKKKKHQSNNDDLVCGAIEVKQDKPTEKFNEIEDSPSRVKNKSRNKKKHLSEKNKTHDQENLINEIEESSCETFQKINVGNKNIQKDLKTNTSNLIKNKKRRFSIDDKNSAHENDISQNLCEMKDYNLKSNKKKSKEGTSNHEGLLDDSELLNLNKIHKNNKSQNKKYHEKKKLLNSVPIEQNNETNPSNSEECINLGKIENPEDIEKEHIITSKGKKIKRNNTKDIIDQTDQNKEDTNDNVISDITMKRKKKTQALKSFEEQGESESATKRKKVNIPDETEECNGDQNNLCMLSQVNVNLTKKKSKKHLKNEKDVTGDTLLTYDDISKLNKIETIDETEIPKRKRKKKDYEAQEDLSEVNVKNSAKTNVEENMNLKSKKKKKDKKEHNLEQEEFLNVQVLEYSNEDQKKEINDVSKTSIKKKSKKKKTKHADDSDIYEENEALKNSAEKEKLEENIHSCNKSNLISEGQKESKPHEIKKKKKKNLNVKFIL